MNAWYDWAPSIITAPSRPPMRKGTCMDPDVLAPACLAERLGLTEDATVSLLANGTLPARKLGTHWRAYWPAVLAAFETDTDPGTDVIRLATLAERLGLTRDTTLRLLNQGVLPGCRLGRQWRIYWPAVVARLSETSAEQPAQPAPA